MTARVWAFALRSLVRQPGRAILGILGVAAVGALLFDMLLLSRGLLVSFRALLDSAGFDVRVMAADATVLARPRIADAEAAAAAIRALPDVDEVVSLRLGNATATATRKASPASWVMNSSATSAQTTIALATISAIAVFASRIRRSTIRSSRT